MFSGRDWKKEVMAGATSVDGGLTGPEVRWATAGRGRSEEKMLLLGSNAQDAAIKVPHSGIVAGVGTCRMSLYSQELSIHAGQWV